MSLLRNKSLIRRRKFGGNYVKGQWIPGEPDDTPFKGSWQPASGKTLELLPEGKRSREAYRCFAPIKIDFRSADAHGDKEADMVLCNGVEYEVTTAAEWNNGILPHWNLICTRPREGEK